MFDRTTIQTEYPFRSNWLELAGNRYHYLDEGPRDAPVVLMLHGNPTWSYYYRTIIPALSKTHRVVVPDHMGCGLSDKPQTYPYTVEQHIKNVARLIETLELRDITLMLHDWGGVIGMGYAIDHPQNVKQFVLFNTAAFYLRKIPFLILLCRPKLLGGFIVRGLNAFTRVATYMAMSNGSRMKNGVRAGYLAPYDSWANRIAIHRFVQDIPWEDDHPSLPQIQRIDEEILQFRDRPMLILWGADDFVFDNKFLAEWRRRFPQAEVHVLENAGHYVVEDAHERIVPLVEQFLESRQNL